MSLVASLGLESSALIALCGAGGKTSLMFALADECANAGHRVLIATTTRMALAQARGRWSAFRAEDAGAIAGVAPAVASAVIVYREVDEARGKIVGHAPEVIDEVAAGGRFTRILIEADGAARRPLKAPAAHEPVFPASTDAVVMLAGASGIGRPLDDETVFRAGIWSQLTGAAFAEPVTPEAVALVAVHPDGLARTAPRPARRALFVNQADNPQRLAAARQVLEHLDRLVERFPGATMPERSVVGQLLPRVEIHQARACRPAASNTGRTR